MGDQTYIEGEELRRWVKQHLTRILFSTAHELAVQTRCEILIKIQDSQNVKDSHYFATRSLDEAFCNGGLRKQQWDVKVSDTSIPKTESDPLPLKIVSAVSLLSDGQQDTAGGSSAAHQQDNSADDADMPTARRHPFGIIPRKQQQNNTTTQRAETTQSQEQLANTSHQVMGGSSPSKIKITKTNPNCAMVQVVPTQQQTASAQVLSTPMQIAGNTVAGTPTQRTQFMTYDPMQQLNQLKQGQVFIMQKVGNTQVLTPVAVQQAQGGGTMVSPTQQTDKELPAAQRKLTIRPANSRTNPTQQQESPGAGGQSGGFSGRPFKCGVCYKTFGSIQVLTRHSQTFHELIPNKRFYCDLCGKNYKHPQHLQQHMATHNSMAPYKCSQCHRGFYRMGTLKDHELLHLGMYRYYCPECRKGFMRPSLLQEPVNRFHTATVAPVENTSSVVPANLMYAQQVVGQDADLDGTSVQDNDGEEAGADANPSDGNANEDANLNDETSPNVGDDNLNGITIKQERLSPVAEMDQDGESDMQPSTNDDQHDQAGLNDGTSVLGQLPSMVTMSSSSPAGTMGKMNPKFAYTTIKSPGQVTAASVAANSGGGRPQRRYSCDICRKTYKYVFHMREHRLTHSGEHPFVCKICNTGFFRQRQLREHQFRHSGSFPYSCDKCNKGFFRPSELRRHKSVKHGIVATGGDD